MRYVELIKRDLSNQPINLNQIYKFEDIKRTSSRIAETPLLSFFIWVNLLLQDLVEKFQTFKSSYECDFQ